LGMQDFDFAQISSLLLKFASILLKFRFNFAQSQPVLPKQLLLRDAAASPAPTALLIRL